MWISPVGPEEQHSVENGRYIRYLIRAFWEHPAIIKPLMILAWKNHNTKVLPNHYSFLTDLALIEKNIFFVLPKNAAIDQLNYFFRDSLHFKLYLKVIN